MSLELEEEWAKQKAAKQEAGRKLDQPPKSRKGLVVALVTVALIGGMVAVVIYAGDERRSDVGRSGTVEQIRVEMRAYPVAEIRVDGKKLGKTPLSLTYTRSTKQITVEATMVRHLVRRGATRDDVYKDVRTITLDRDHLLDFKLDKANLVEQGEDAPTAGSAHP
jgi:hypothetical protein